MAAGSLIVARKELLDHLRDTRSIMSMTVHALMGPGVVMLVSFSGAARGDALSTILVSMMSVFALVSSFAGGMNIALDATAGEYERRSMLPLLMNSVAIRDVVLGKWMTTSLFTVGALFINIAGVCLVLTTRAPALLTAHGLGLMQWVAFGLLPLALLGAAVELLVASNARSTKEASTWLTIVAFLPMLAGIVLVFFPGRLGHWWCVMPVIGQQVLIGKSLSGQSASLLYVIVLAVVTAAASAPVLTSATRVIGRAERLSR
ncbi:MAG TPA: ABC transporter permease subunit [Vicinamibacterales bacterium]|jgi:sodium transport system permease protein|nr:ABC transporter permease subunit [Vicinamibacterales bacterium]